MPSGDGSSGFSRDQQLELRQVLQRASADTKLHFELYVGELPQDRESALALQQRYRAPDDTVLIALDPHRQSLHLVTGARARLQCDDVSCALASAAMLSSFESGDLYGGLRNGLLLLADQATDQQLRHLSTR